MLNLTKLPLEAQFILYGSKTSLTEADIIRLKQLIKQKLDWGEIAFSAIFHRTASLLYQAIISHGFLMEIIPEDTCEKLKNYYYASLAKNTVLWQEFMRIQQAAIEANIEFVPLKGIILGRLIYQNQALRPVISDIDLLVKESELKAAYLVLRRLGYEFYPDVKGEGHVQGVFKNRITSIELHQSFIIPWLNRFDMEKIWQKTSLFTIEGKNIRVLSDEDTLLSLTTQVRYGLENFTLIRICDFNEILSRKASSLDWDYLLNSAKDYSLRGPLLLSLLFASKLLNAPIPEMLSFRLNKNSLKRKLLPLLLDKEVKRLINADVRWVAFDWYSWLLKILMTDSLSDLFKIFKHQPEKVRLV